MQLSSVYSEKEIREQLNRVLSSSVFKNSPILSRFLEYITTETIQKNEQQIKEYSIALHVLGRSRDFNPSGDSVVRIHAGRLRRALTDYYLTQGMYDPIIIHIPKGCYVPEFLNGGIERQKGNQLSALLHKTHKPLVAIFPLSLTTHNEDLVDLYTLMEARLSEELVRLSDITVVAYYSMGMEAKIKENVLEAGRSVGADYIITGSLINIGNQIRVLVILLVPATGEVLLCKSFDGNILYSGISGLMEGLTQNLVGFADGCYHFIFQEKQKSA